MHFNAVEIAVWIIILVVIYRLFSRWLMTIFQEEKLAAKLEYEDLATSEERKRDLLTRYANSIVEAPAHEFLSAARQQMKREKKENRKLEVFLEIFSLVAAVLVGLLVIFGHYLLHLVISFFQS